MHNFRSQLRTQRKALDNKFKKMSAEKIITKICQLNIFKVSKNIAFYLADEGEVDLGALIELALQQKKHCYLPLLDPKQKWHLLFNKFNFKDQLIADKNTGILEPKLDPKKIILPKNLDLVFVPLVGFNQKCYRIGRGAGCYDKTFAFKLIQKNPEKTQPCLIGVAYEFQKIEFEQCAWDVPMQIIITEDGVSTEL
ncbi:MAG: 5-formyltetrahydrofolate cyclo-ligase [Gammaproteobacteria bacterium]|nr:5-formyltetrahydrofolate cyclo-ligase [Gammaproteobacteria bacterium]